MGRLSLSRSAVQLFTAAGCAAQLANTFSRSSDTDPGFTVDTHTVCSGSSVVPPGVDVHTGDLYVDPTPPIQNKRLRRRQDADASNAAEPVTFREPAGHE